MTATTLDAAAPLPATGPAAPLPAAPLPTTGRPAGSRGAGRWVLRLAVLVYMALLILLPLGSVVYRACSSGPAASWHALTAPAVHALVLTLLVVAVAVPADTIFGVGVALLLARRRFPGDFLLDAAVNIPLAMSPVIIGLALVLCYGRTGWFGNWLAAHGIQIIFSVPGIIMASAFVALPYVVRQVLPVLQEVGIEREQAAATLGAGPWRIFWRVTMPAIRGGLVYGVTLTTARVLGEFGAVSVVSGNVENKTQTLTLWVSDQFGSLNLVGAYTGALLLALLALGALLVINRATRGKEATPWASPFGPSPSASMTRLRSMTSASPSRAAP